MKFRGRLATLYIFTEMLPSFFLGVVIFILILLSFQALRLTEFILVHGVSLQNIFDIVTFLSISFLPAILPMSLLFSVLLCYGRLSGDSEIIAFKATGLNMNYIALPALLLGLAISFSSAYTSFYVGPWGNRQFEILINRLGQTKAAANIKEGSFAEGFFDMVFYANEVDSKTGQMAKIFIYDERNASSPLTILAKRGQIIQNQKLPGHFALLRLIDGSIHKNDKDTYTIIHFDTYDFNLSSPVDFKEKDKSMPSMNFKDISQELKKIKIPEQLSVDEKVQFKKIIDRRMDLRIEFHKRMALSVACILFAMIGVGLGTETNRRSGKSSGMALSLVIIVAYWIFYIGGENLARKDILPLPIAMWLGDFCFLIFALYRLRKVWR